MERTHYAVRNPIRLYAQPVYSFDADSDWMLVAEDVQGNLLTIVASRERFADALMGKGLRQMTEAEQVRAMYLRDEVEIESFERALDRERHAAR